MIFEQSGPSHRHTGMILNHVSISFFFKKKENDGLAYTVPLILFVAIYRNKYNDKEDIFQHFFF